MTADHGNGKVATPGGTTEATPDVLTQLRAIRDELAVLAHREQERAAHREAVIDRLHAENQALHRHELDAMLEPVRTGLYRLYDIACREADRWSGPAAPAAEHAGPLLTLIAEEISDVLAGTGVQPFPAHRGEPYDPARHRPVDTEQVAEPALNGAVTRTVNNGFSRGDVVVRRADVIVGQFGTPGTGSHQTS